MNLKAIGALVVFVITVIAGFHLFVRSQSVYEYKRTPFQYAFPVSNQDDANNRIEVLRALLTQKSSPLVMTEMAQALLKRGRQTGSSADYDEAEKLARQALKESADAFPAHVLLVEILQHRHEFEEAASIIEKYRGTHGNDTSFLDLATRLALARGNHASAEKDAKQLAELLPRSGSFTLLAQVFEAQGQIAKAEHAYRNAFALEDVGSVTGAAYLRALYGRFLLRRNQVNEARVLIEEGLRLHSNSTFLVELKADLDFTRGHYRDAEKVYLSVFDISEDPFYLIKAAKSRKKAGNKKEAVSLLNQTLDIVKASDATSEAGQYNYDAALALVEREQKGDLQKALPLIEEELKNRSTIELIALKIRTLRGLGQSAEAQKILDGHRAQIISRPDLF